MTAPLHPVSAAQVERVGQNVSLGEMFELARAEAARIEIVQRALIDCGHRSEPDAGQMRNMHIFDAMGRYFDREMRRA